MCHSPIGQRPCQVPHPPIHQGNHQNPNPYMTSWDKWVTSRPPRANVQVEDGGGSSSTHAKVPPKEMSSTLILQHPSSNVPHMWGIASIYGF
jgi:hypothetical protein